MKKMTALMLAILLMLLSAACSKSHQTAAPGGDASAEQSDAAQTEAAEEAATAPPATVNADTQSYSTESFTIMKGSAFNNGVAWITARGDKDHKSDVLALVNTKGEVIRLLDDEAYTTATEFTGDLSAVYNDGSNGRTHPGFLLINRQGEIVYSCFDENLYLVGYTEDGRFLVVKHDAGFDHDTWTLMILDASLSMKDTGIKVSDSILYEEGRTEMITEDLLWFTRNNGTLINLKAGVCIPHGALGLLGSNDKYVVYYGYSYLPHGYYGVPIELVAGAADEASLAEQIKDNSSVITYSLPEDAYVENIAFSEVHNGVFYRSYSLSDSDNQTTMHYEYIDITGKLLFSFPEFAEGTRYIDDEWISGGYTAVYLKGVDGEDYATVLDETGKAQYEPVKIDTEGHSSCNGYIFLFKSDINYTVTDIIAPDGTHKKLGDKLPGLDDEQYTDKKYIRFTIGDGIFKMAIGGGYILCDEESLKYVAVDGSGIISSFTAGYNKNGDLIYTDPNGNKTVCKTAVPTAPAGTNAEEATTA